MNGLIDSGLVLALADRNDLARSFLESLADRMHNRKVTTVERVMKKFKARRREVVDLFKAMAEIGLGEFVPGRRTQSSRFVWTTRMTEVGRVVIGEDAEIEQIDSDDLEDDLEDEINIEEDDEFFDSYEHTFKLRAGFEPLVLALPKDLTQQEADRLAAFIKTLPL